MQSFSVVYMEMCTSSTAPSKPHLQFVAESVLSLLLDALTRCKSRLQLKLRKGYDNSIF